ncbi:MAG: hypothetical protein HY744_20195 [Deltaproteobacteria bacterium]|nr:hypothetical protein [Deltaproteobacteria bacterium]
MSGKRALMVPGGGRGQGETRPVRLRQREGEGVSVTVRRLPIADAGPSRIERLDLAAARVPGRRYQADAGDAVARDGRVQILFAQRRCLAGLRSLVVVNVSPEGVRNILASCVEFLPRLREYLDSRKLPAAVPLERTEEPAQAVALVANLALIAYADTEALIDFYHASAWSLRVLAQGGQDLAVDPVVRVDLSVTLLRLVLDRLQELERELPEPLVND